MEARPNPPGPAMRRFPWRRRLTALAAAGLTVAAVALVPATQHTVVSVEAASAAQAPAASGSIVIDWNKELLTLLSTPGVQPATIHPTRSLAILHAAIYDAVVSITHTYKPYLFSVDARLDARPDAAAVQAGHDTLAALYPGQKAPLDGLLSGELAKMPNGAAKQDGIEVGQLAAELLLATRADDGSSVTPPVVPAGDQPGTYRPTPPMNAPPVFTQWPNVRPFVLKNANQFPVAPPPAVGTAAYTQNLNEVESLGQDTSRTRTADQTQSAKFWAGPPWITWNQIAENSAVAHHSNLVQTARLFALLNLSLGDGVIAFYAAKYRYLVWRPVTAIRAAGNATWSPLLPTPADPSYPGAHSVLSGAAATVLVSFYGDHNRIRATAAALPGVVRTFNSYSAAALDTGLSRVWGGVHTPADHVAGLKLGKNVAGYVLRRSRASVFGLR